MATPKKTTTKRSAAKKTPAVKSRARVKPVKNQRSAPKKKAPAASKQKAVVARIKEVLVVPKGDGKPVLATPLPVKEVKNFGDLPFESQARMVFNALPANEGEVIGQTDNSGAGTVSPPAVAQP